MFAKRILAGLMVAGILTDTASLAQAAEFDVVKISRHGPWSAVLYKNRSGNRLFCAAETKDGNTDFRINRYKASGEAFLEVYNLKWTMMSGNVQFSLDFNVGEENYQAELTGKSWGDSYTFDFTDTKGYEALLGLISRSKSFEVRNSNNVVIAKFNGNGAKDAIVGYRSCLEK